MTDAPCPYDPRKLAGEPIGMFHCPLCGEMQLAGMEHLPPEVTWEGPAKTEGEARCREIESELSRLEGESP